MAQDSPSIALDSHITDPATVTNEKHNIKVDGTSGTWTWLWDGESVAAIPFNLTAAQLAAKIADGTRLSASDITVTGGPGNSGGTTPYVMTFVGDYAGEAVPTATATDELSGGGAAVTITVLQEGGVATKAVRRGDAPLADAEAVVNPLLNDTPAEAREESGSDYGDA